MICIRHDVDVMALLRDRGLSSYAIAQRRIFGSSTLTKFRQHGRPSMGELERLCAILECQPGDLIEYRPDD